MKIIQKLSEIKKGKRYLFLHEGKDRTIAECTNSKDSNKQFKIRYEDEYGNIKIGRATLHDDIELIYELTDEEWLAEVL